MIHKRKALISNQACRYPISVPDRLQVRRFPQPHVDLAATGAQQRRRGPHPRTEEQGGRQQAGLAQGGTTEQDHREREVCRRVRRAAQVHQFEPAAQMKAQVRVWQKVRGGNIELTIVFLDVTQNSVRESEHVFLE